MEYKKFANKYVIRMDKGEEIISTLKKFCEENQISLGRVSGIGAVNKASIGLFETKTKEYHSLELSGDHEITSLSGNISKMDGEVYLHLHANLADSSYNTKGGHLSQAFISATGEFIVEEIEGELDRKFSEEIGLNLLQF
ncbi:PPC domain-containing DNA-binding protein [Natronospora cellulosivora (SeqCode)]